MPTAIQPPILSAILPAYNAAETINQSIASVLAQTFTAFELIVVNDGSTDNTAECLAAMKDSRIRIMHNPHNMGIPATMNRALDAATGRYIAILNADDLSIPERFVKQLAVMHQYDVQVCSGNFVVRMGHNDFITQHQEHDAAIKAAMLFENQIGNPFAMLDGEFLRQHAIRYNERLSCAIDYTMWLEIIRSHPQASFYNIQEPLGIYHVHPNNISMTKRKEQIHNATTAQYTLLHSLDATVTYGHMILHQRMYCGTFTRHSPEQEIAMKNWIQRLRDINKQSNFFQHDIFEGYCDLWLEKLRLANA